MPAEHVTELVGRYVSDPVQAARVSAALVDPALARIAKVTIIMCVFRLSIRAASHVAREADL